MVDACAANGIFPYYGPFGDIKDVVACEDQFRNAFLLGCVGAWTPAPRADRHRQAGVQPRASADVAHARRVVEAMGDGTGAVMLDGKMEDDASLKQCRVMVELAEPLAGDDPELAPPTTRSRSRPEHDARLPAPPLGAVHARRPTSGPWRRPRRIPCDGLILDLEDAVAPDAKPAAREAACAAVAVRRVRPPELTIRINGVDTEWHEADLAAAAAGPDAIVVPKVDSAARCARWSTRWRSRRARPHDAVGDGRDAGRDARTPRRSPPRPTG